MSSTSIGSIDDEWLAVDLDEAWHFGRSRLAETLDLGCLPIRRAYKHSSGNLCLASILLALVVSILFWEGEHGTLKIEEDSF